jgi:hypothetical protein
MPHLGRRDVQFRDFRADIMWSQDCESIRPEGRPMTVVLPTPRTFALPRRRDQLTCRWSSLRLASILAFPLVCRARSGLYPVSKLDRDSVDSLARNRSVRL